MIRDMFSKILRRALVVEIFVFEKLDFFHLLWSRGEYIPLFPNNPFGRVSPSFRDSRRIFKILIQVLSYRKGVGMELALASRSFMQLRIAAHRGFFPFPVSWDTNVVTPVFYFSKIWMEIIKTNVFLSAIFVRSHRLPKPRKILSCSKTAAARFLFIGSIWVIKYEICKINF